MTLKEKKKKLIETTRSEIDEVGWWTKKKKLNIYVYFIVKWKSADAEVI